MNFYYEGYFEGCYKNYKESYNRNFELNKIYIHKGNQVYSSNMKEIVRNILDNNIKVDEYEGLDKWRFDKPLFNLGDERDKQDFENLIYGEINEQGFIINRPKLEEIDEFQATELIKYHLYVEMLKNGKYTIKEFKKFLGEDFILLFS